MRKPALASVLVLGAMVGCRGTGEEPRAAKAETLSDSSTAETKRHVEDLTKALEEGVLFGFPRTRADVTEKESFTFTFHFK